MQSHHRRKPHCHPTTIICWNFLNKQTPRIQHKHKREEIPAALKTLHANFPLASSPALECSVTKRKSAPPVGFNLLWQYFLMLISRTFLSRNQPSLYLRSQQSLSGISNSHRRGVLLWVVKKYRRHFFWKVCRAVKQTHPQIGHRWVHVRRKRKSYRTCSRFRNERRKELSELCVNCV